MCTRSPPTTFLYVAVALVGLLCATPARSAMGEDVRVCNNNKKHDVKIAYAYQARAGGIAQLVADDFWTRSGWHIIPAGQCKLLFELHTAYHDMYLVVTVNGDRIHWKGSKTEKFCTSTTPFYQKGGRATLRSCKPNDYLETFYYFGSIETLDDEHSIYNFENRTVYVEFNYTPPATPPAKKTATPPADWQPGIAHPTISNLVASKVQGEWSPAPGFTWRSKSDLTDVSVVPLSSVP